MNRSTEAQSGTINYIDTSWPQFSSSLDVDRMGSIASHEMGLQIPIATASQQYNDYDSSPQFSPSAVSLPPLIATSTASASSLSAKTSSPTPRGFLQSSISGGVTPSALCKAPSRSSPRSLSMAVRRSGSISCLFSISRILDEVAVHWRSEFSWCEWVKLNIPIASYWRSCRFLGSSRFNGSGKADSSGI